MTLYPGDLGNGQRLQNQVSIGPPPDRRPFSLRRTTSMHSLWPSGPTGPLTVVGIGRDLSTGADVNTPRVVSEDRIEITMRKDRRIGAVTGTRLDAELASFAGLRPSGELRDAMARVIPDEVARSTIVAHLLDELAGAIFMSMAAWFKWLRGGLEEFETLTGSVPKLQRQVEGLCVSFQAGSPSVKDGMTNEDLADHPHRAPPFREDEPLAWHPFPAIDGPNQWRIRWLDLWREDDGMLHAASGFQDSSALPGTTERLVFHEYRVAAVIDPEGLVLRAIDVTPGVLPFRTCHAAPAGAQRLLGRSVRDLRGIVLGMFAGPAGCTHLNEVLRALQDVESLASSLAR